MVVVLPALMYSITEADSLQLALYMAIPIAEPSKAKISATVVEVGRPRVLNISNKITFATITAMKSTISSWKLNMPGTNTPLRATSIMPLEKAAPMMTPTPATAATRR